MGNIEIVTSVLSGIVITSSILTLLVQTKKIRTISIKKKSLRKTTRVFFYTEPSTKGPRVKMKPEYGKQHVIFETNPFTGAIKDKAFKVGMKPEYRRKQTEVVKSIVDLYSEFPLSDILKNPIKRNIIYESLSDPNKYYRGTEESESELSKFREMVHEIMYGKTREKSTGSD